MDVTQGKIEEVVTGDELLLEKISRYKIMADAHYTEKDFLLEREGIGFSPRGNVCAIAAEKKAGKTWLCMALSAAVLNGSFLGFTSRYKDTRVLYFDTEQDKGDGQRIQRRVHFACGWDFEIDNDRFQIFHLREIAPAERRSFVKEAIEYLKPDFVIVDGIRDLLSDFNDLEESASVIQEHMKLSSEQNCCIWDILHVNPNSEKMRGHLGTELGNKVADILYMTKKKDPGNEDNVTYKMEETDARGHKDIKSVTFFIDDSLPYSMPAFLSESQVKQMDTDRRQELREIFLKYINDARAYSKTNLQKSLITGENMGGGKAWKMINEAITLGVIEQVIGGKYRMKNIPDEATQTDMPF